MTNTISVEGVVTTANTRTLLTKQGSVTAPSLVVPAGMKKIDKIYATASANFAGAGTAAIFVRLGGNAVLNGEQTFMIAGAGGQLPQTGSDTNGSRTLLFELNNADINIAASDTINVSGEMAGDDLGQVTIGVTIVYA